MAEREYTVSIKADSSSFQAAFKAASGVVSEFSAGLKDGFREGAAEVEKGAAGVKRFGDEAERAGSRAISSWDSIALKITGAVAAMDIAGKAMSAIGTSIEAVFAGISRGADLDDLSQRLGVAVEQLSSLELAAQLGGVSMESMGTGLQILARNMTEAAAGGKEAQAAFEAVGIKASELADLGTDEVLQRIAEQFSKAEDGASKTALSMDLLGKSGASLIPVLNKGAEGLAQQAELAQRLGIVVSTEMAQAMGAAADSVDILGFAVTGVQNQLAVGMAPALAVVSAAAIDLVSNLGIADGGLSSFGEAIGASVVRGVDAALGALNTFVETVYSLGLGDALLQVFGAAFLALEELAAAQGRVIGLKFVQAFASAVDGLLDSIPGLMLLDKPFTNLAQGSIDEATRQVSALAASFSSLGQGSPELAKLSSALESARAQLAAFDPSVEKNDAHVAAWKASMDGAAGSLPRVTSGTDAAAASAKKAADEIGKLRDRFEEQIRTQTEAVEKMEGQNEALQQIIDGNLSAADAQTVLNDATGEAAAVAALAAGATAEEAVALGNLAIRAAEAAQANRELQATRNAQTQTQALTQEAALLQQVLAGTKDITVAEHELAVIREQSKGVTLEQAEAFVTAQENVEELRDRITEMDEDVIHLGDVFKDSFEQAFDAVIDGTRDMGDVLEGIGIGIGKRFFSAMLDSKLRDFDPTVKANFLDLGEFGKSVFGDLFSGAGGTSGGSVGGGSSGGFLDWVGKGIDWLGNLGTSSSPAAGLQIIGQNADGSFIFSDGSSAWGQSIDDGSSAASGSSFAGDLLGGAVGGFATSTALNPYVFRRGATSLTGLAARGAEPGIFSNANVLNGVIGTIIGAILGAMGLGPVGGVIGGAISSGIGALVMDSIDRDALRNRRFSGGLAGGIEEMESWFGFMGKDGLSPAALIFNLLGIPTLGTAFRRAGESMIDSSKIFGNEGLQGLLGDFTRDKNGRLGLDDNYRTGGQTALDRGFTEEQLQKVLGASTNIFSVLAEGEYAADAGRFAEEMGQSMAEFLSRGLAEGMTFDELFASLRQFAAESGVTLMASIKNLPEVFAQSAAAASEFGKLDVTTSHEQGARAYAQALYGITEIFKGDFPAGVNLASLALQTMELDGVKVFENLDTEGKETLQNLTEDAELFQEVVAKLAAQGFTIDTEEFEKRLEAITQSATFLGENLGAIFNFDSAAAGVEAIFQQIKGDVFEAFQSTSMKQLFEGTNIAAAFEPVYAALDRIDEFDLTTAAGAQDFMAILTPALAEGKANLQDYIPILQVMVDNWKEIQEIIDEAMKPDVFEQAALVAEGAFNGIGGALSTAIEVGLAVLNDGGTWDEAVTAFNASFGAGIEKTFKDAIFNAIVQSVVIEPLIASYQPAFQYVVAAGLIHGFDDPRVRDAFNDLMGDVTSRAEDLGLLIFEAKVDSDGITSDIERTFNEAAEITVQWADDVRGELSGALETAFDVLRDGGSRADAVAAWSEALRDGTADGILEGIAIAMIQSTVIEPFIQKWAPIVQYWVAAGMEHGFDDERVVRARDELFGPDSDFMKELENIGPISIDIFGNFAGWENPPPGKTGDDGTNGTASFRGGFATGGAVPHGSSFIVGEAGPELVLTDGTGSTIIPLDPTVANAMLGGGVAGYEDGSVPRGHGPFRPSGNPVRRPLIPGGSNDDPIRPYVPPPDNRDRGSGEEFELKVGLEIDDALDEFLRSGDFAAFEDAFNQAVNDAVSQGIMDAILNTGPLAAALETFNEELTDAIEKAWADGSLTDEEIAEIRRRMEEFGGPIADMVERLGPELADLFRDLGLELGDSVSSNLRDALGDVFREFASTGDIDAMAEALNQTIFEAVLDGIVRALLLEGPLADAIDRAGDRLQRAIEKAMEDGEISDREARRLRRLARQLGEDLGDIFDDFGDIFDGIFGGLRNPLERLTAEARDLVGGALRGALNDPANLTFDFFADNLKQAIYQKVSQGLIDAFLESAVINGLLAGPLAAIEAIFERIAAGQLDAIDDIADVIEEILRLLNDPAIKEAIGSLLDGLRDIADGLGVASAGINRASNGFEGAADAAANACTGECDLEQKLVTTNEKLIALDGYGRVGGSTDSYYEYVERPTRSASGADIPDIPQMAEGGIVTSPTFALIGEAGPEAVIPLSRGGSESELVKEIRALREELRTQTDKTVGAIQSDRHTTVTMDSQVLIDAWTQAKRVADKAGIPFGG